MAATYWKEPDLSGSLSKELKVEMSVIQFFAKGALIE